MLPDYYQTVAQEGTFEFKEKGSKFIGHVFPVSNREQAEEAIELLGKKYYDATHNCFAYQIGYANNELYRFNDDGEPSGTAGKPILQSIKGKNLTNLCIIVTRYFGGTKLGTGGLLRAYSKAANEALKVCTIKKVYLTKLVKLEFHSDLIGVVMKMIKKFKGEIKHRDYKDNNIFLIDIRNSFADQFIAQIVEDTAGKIKVENQ
jgi:uncharacterized YigZ family protein